MISTLHFLYTQVLRNAINRDLKWFKCKTSNIQKETKKMREKFPLFAHPKLFIKSVT